MLNSSTTSSNLSISDIYQKITLIHPEFWFSSRDAVPLIKQTPYLVFLLLLFLVAIFLWWRKLRSKGDILKKRFFRKNFYLGLFFSFLAMALISFRLWGVPLLSARILWLALFLALGFWGYLGFLDYNKKLPERSRKLETSQVKKRYLKPLRGKR